MKTGSASCAQIVLVDWKQMHAIDDLPFLCSVHAGDDRLRRCRWSNRCSQPPSFKNRLVQSLQWGWLVNWRRIDWKSLISDSPLALRFNCSMASLGCSGWAAITAHQPASFVIPVNRKGTSVISVLSRWTLESWLKEPKMHLHQIPLIPIDNTWRRRCQLCHWGT